VRSADLEGRPGDALDGDPVSGRRPRPHPDDEAAVGARVDVSDLAPASVARARLHDDAADAAHEPVQVERGA
jgi:hypothetical protein